MILRSPICFPIESWPLRYSASTIRVLAFVAIAIAVTSCSKTDPKSKSATAKKSTVQKPVSEVIPFKLTDANNVSVAAVLNDVDSIQLMFHTAVNSVSIIESSGNKLESLKFGEQGNAKSWGGNSKIGVSRGNRLQIGNLKWDDVLITSDKHSGPKRMASLVAIYSTEKSSNSILKSE